MSTLTASQWAPSLVEMKPASPLPWQRAPLRCVFVGGLKLLWMEVQALDAQEPPSAVEVTGMRLPCAALRQWAGVPVQMWQGRAPVPVQMWQG